MHKGPCPVGASPQKLKLTTKGTGQSKQETAPWSKVFHISLDKMRKTILRNGNTKRIWKERCCRMCTSLLFGSSFRSSGDDVGLSSWRFAQNSSLKYYFNRWISDLCSGFCLELEEFQCGRPHERLHYSPIADLTKEHMSIYWPSCVLCCDTGSHLSLLIRGVSFLISFMSGMLSCQAWLVCVHTQGWQIYQHW